MRERTRRVTRVRGMHRRRGAHIARMGARARALHPRRDRHNSLSRLHKYRSRSVAMRDYQRLDRARISQDHLDEGGTGKAQGRDGRGENGEEQGARGQGRACEGRGEGQGKRAREGRQRGEGRGRDGKERGRNGEREDEGEAKGKGCDASARGKEMGWDGIRRGPCPSVPSLPSPAIVTPPAGEVTRA
jgi:hypothetical protein